MKKTLKKSQHIRRYSRGIVHAHTHRTKQSTLFMTTTQQSGVITTNIYAHTFQLLNRVTAPISLLFLSHEKEAIYLPLPLLINAPLKPACDASKHTLLMEALPQHNTYTRQSRVNIHKNTFTCYIPLKLACDASKHALLMEVCVRVLERAFASLYRQRHLGGHCEKSTQTIRTMHACMLQRHEQ